HGRSCGAVACGTRLVRSYPSPANQMRIGWKNVRFSAMRAHKSLRGDHPWQSDARDTAVLEECIHSAETRRAGLAAAFGGSTSSRRRCSTVSRRANREQPSGLDAAGAIRQSAPQQLTPDQVQDRRVAKASEEVA